MKLFDGDDHDASLINWYLECAPQPSRDSATHLPTYLNCPGDRRDLVFERGLWWAVVNMGSASVLQDSFDKDANH